MAGILTRFCLHGLLQNTAKNKAIFTLSMYPLFTEQYSAEFRPPKKVIKHGL